MITEQGKLKIERELSIHCVNKREDDTLWFDKYKFAELIVRECVEVANNHFESKEPGYPGDKIEEHFGVEQ